MSIATELTNLAANRDAIKAAIESKGVADAGDTLAEFPTAIASIPSGGSDEWTPPSEWPNLRTLLANDAEDYTNKIYCLFDTVRDKQVPNIFAFIQGADKAVTSDGSTYTSNATHTWSSAARQARFGWIAWYSTTGFTRIGASSYSVILWIVGDVTDAIPFPSRAFAENNFLREIDIPMVAGGDSYQAFYNCQRLESIPKTIDTTDLANGNNFFGNCMRLCKVRLSSLASLQNGNTLFSNTALQEVSIQSPNATALKNMSYMFSGSGWLSSIPDGIKNMKPTNLDRVFYSTRGLVSVPTLDFTDATSCAYIFADSFVMYPPDVINLKSIPSASAQNAMFSYAKYIRRLPTNVTSKWSMSFAQCTMVDEKDSVATFDYTTSPITVTGGFVGNLRSWNGTEYVAICPNSGQTITLNSAIKGLFTAEEQAAIETVMSNKNWTLSW